MKRSPINRPEMSLQGLPVRSQDEEVASPVLTWINLFCVSSSEKYKKGLFGRLLFT